VRRVYGDSVYYFQDAEAAIAALQSAWRDEPARRAKVMAAREITLHEHLYEHRAGTLISTVRQAEEERQGASDHKLAWIIGCGRTGSTWLAEMLGDLPRIRRWHEPYFGRFLKHVNEHPEDEERRASFFFKRHRQVWIDGLRDLFFRMARERFSQFGRHALVVKEVNTPEMYPWLAALFPAAKLILLVRDPFDVLDSYLDLQKPGSWNQSFTATEENVAERVRHTAEHIRATLVLALEAFNAFPLEQRLQLTYEDLLRDAAPRLQQCGELLGMKVSAAAAREAIAKHAFSKYEQTGELQFRRRGEAGVWRSSGNFTPEVLAIAEDVLGPMRGRLGYTQQPT
jgi:hypothetical protein